MVIPLISGHVTISNRIRSLPKSNPYAFIKSNKYSIPNLCFLQGSYSSWPPPLWIRYRSLSRHITSSALPVFLCDQCFYNYIYIPFLQCLYRSIPFSKVYIIVNKKIKGISYALKTLVVILQVFYPISLITSITWFSLMNEIFSHGWLVFLTNYPFFVRYHMFQYYYFEIFIQKWQIILN